MTRITVDVSPVLQGHAGVGRYTQALTRALLAGRPPDEAWVALGVDARRRPLADLPLPLLAYARSNKAWRAQVALAHLLRLSQRRLAGAPDVFIASDFVLPYLPGTRTVFILHDLTFALLPQTHSLLNRVYLQWMTPRFLRAAAHIVAVSESTRADALRLYGLAPERVHVVYGAAGPEFAPVTEASALAAVRRRYDLPPRFILFVGTLEPRKNLVTLLKAFTAAQLPEVALVLAGRAGWRTAALRRQLAEAGPQVRALGFVPDEDLPALYSLAEAFAFPSLYEGFGLPVLEAMACGAPVLCSEVASLPEVAGDAARLLPPTDARAWAEALQRITTDPALRAELRARGLAQAQRFSWARAARQFRQLYRGQGP